MWGDSLGESYLGRIVRGIVKIALAGVILALLSNVDINLSSVSIGGTTVNLQVIWDVIRIFGPLFMVVDGLRDLGVRL